MSDKNKAILEEANAAIAQGNYEGFLSFCTDDTEWTFVGDRTLKGKAAVIAGLATAEVFRRSGSVWTAVIVHVVFNLPTIPVMVAAGIS